MLFIVIKFSQFTVSQINSFHGVDSRKQKIFDWHRTFDEAIKWVMFEVSLYDIKENISDKYNNVLSCFALSALFVIAKTLLNMI